MMASAAKIAKPKTIENIIIGTGLSSSAIIGDNIVKSLAPILHIPKAVPAKIAGKMVEFAK